VKDVENRSTFATVIVKHQRGTLFETVKKQHINGAQINSDTWDFMPDAHPDTTLAIKLGLGPAP